MDSRPAASEGVGLPSAPGPGVDITLGAHMLDPGPRLDPAQLSGKAWGPALALLATVGGEWGGEVLSPALARPSGVGEQKGLVGRRVWGQVLSRRSPKQTPMGSS